MERDIRESFEIASRFYDFRVPYHPRLFEVLAQELAFTPETAVLDVCCGPGHVASALCNHVGRVVGFDFSEKMLALAPRHERIEYLLHDVNGPMPAPPEIAGVRFDHFFFGRSIHWVDSPNLGTLVQDNLRPGGTIVVCLAALRRELNLNPWIDAFNKLRDEYSYRDQNLDHTGMDRLPVMGFQPLKRFAVQFRVLATVDTLLTHAMSYGRSAALIEQDRDNFGRRLADILAPYLTDGSIHAHAHSLALVYHHGLSPQHWQPADRAKGVAETAEIRCNSGASSGVP